MDLLDYQKYSSKNNNYKYILLVCDIFSRKAYAEPIKNKSSKDVDAAFEKVLKEAGNPQLIISDNGSEFMSQSFQNILKQNKIFHQPVEIGYHPALGIIDRLSRTIKERLEKHFTNTSTVKWIDFLPKLMTAYNNTPHKSLNYISPNKVKNNKQLIININQQKSTKGKAIEFAKEQLVRIRLKKPIFTKGYKQEWSTQVFTLQKIEGANGILEDGTKVKLSNLQFVTKVSEPTKQNVQQKKVEKKVKTIRNVRKEGLDVHDITSRLRQRKPEHQLVHDKFGKVVF
jgi:hypothetical protein